MFGMIPFGREENSLFNYPDNMGAQSLYRFWRYEPVPLDIFRIRAIPT